MKSWILVLGAMLSAATIACTRAHDTETDLVQLAGKELPRPPPAPWESVYGVLIEDRGRSTAGAAGPQFSGDIWSSGNTHALLFSQNEGVAGNPRWMVLAVLQAQVPRDHFVTDRCELDGRADPELFAVVTSEAPCPQWYTRVSAAFRLSRSGRRIEPLPARGIRCICMSYGMDAK